MVARSVFVCFKHFPSVLYLRLFLAFSFLCVFVTLSLLVLALSSPLFCRFYLQKNGAKTESQSLLLPCFSSLFFHLFFSLLSLLLPTFLISQQRKDEGKKLPLFSAFSLSHKCLPFLRFFLSFFFLFVSPLVSQLKRFT